MNNFIFENKTKVYFGKGCVGEYLPKIAAVHGDKVLLAYGGGSIKKNGVYEEVIAALERAGKTIIEFPGIMENPTYKKVLEGTAAIFGRYSPTHPFPKYTFVLFSKIKLFILFLLYAI